MSVATCLAALRGDADAQAWIADQSGSRVRWAQSSEVLPHLGMDSSPETVGKKALFLNRMRARLLSGEVDDRDHQMNRRVDGAGPSIGILFRQIIRAHVKTVSILCKRLVEAKKKKKLAKRGGAQKRAGGDQRAAVKRARDSPGP